MKAALVLVVLIVFTASAFYLAWMNRASEKIITAVIPIAIAALVGVFLAVLVFGGEPPITVVFPSSFQYQIESKMPADLPRVLWSRRFADSLFAPAALHRAHPDLLNDPNQPEGGRLYHHLLQRAIIDWMGLRYRTTWQTEITHFDIPTGREERFQPSEDASEPSRVFPTQEIVDLLRGNRFADIHAGIPPQIAVPVGTKFSITVPQRSNGGFEEGEILIKNAFCTLSIRTQLSSWMSGLGVYKQLAGITDEENSRLATVTYTVRIKAEFSRLRSGHPKMRKHRAWARQLVDELKKQFDEQVIWQRTKEDYLFWKQTKQFGPAE